MRIILHKDKINAGLLALTSLESNGQLHIIESSLYGDTCKCHIGFAPCPWCESLTEEEVEIFDSYGSNAVNYIRDIKGEF